MILGNIAAKLLLTMEVGRYRLYAAPSCPFAHRVRMVRLLLALEDSIALSFVTAQTSADGFVFQPQHPEPEFGATTLKAVYEKVASQYKGSYSVPLLIDRTTKSMVNNESLELAVLLAKTSDTPSLLPEGAEPLAKDISDNLSNAVYKFLFASTPEAEEEIQTSLHHQFDHYEALLQEQPYLMGDQIALPDCVLWPTLIRYDNVYARQFGIPGQTVKLHYPALTEYIQRIWELPCHSGSSDGTAAISTTTLGQDANLPEAVRMYWQSETISPKAGNDPKAPVPPLLSLF